MIQWHDGWNDDEANDDDDENDDGDDLDECPRCGRLIYGDSERCPRCGKYLTREELPPTTRQPIWVKVVALICLAMMLSWILRL